MSITRRKHYTPSARSTGHVVTTHRPLETVDDYFSLAATLYTEANTDGPILWEDHEIWIKSHEKKSAPEEIILMRLANAERLFHHAAKLGHPAAAKNAKMIKVMLDALAKARALDESKLHAAESMVLGAALHQQFEATTTALLNRFPPAAAANAVELKAAPSTPMSEKEKAIEELEKEISTFFSIPWATLASIRDLTPLITATIDAKIAFETAEEVGKEQEEKKYHDLYFLIETKVNEYLKSSATPTLVPARALR